jgi:4-hydroxyphenylpyruvate dioxygenase
MSLTSSTPVERKLVGYDNFKRSNPKSDKFEILCFHHVEFYCSDSTNVSRRFSCALGMPIVAVSNLSTGNSKYASTILQSNSLCFVFTAPYGMSFSKGKEEMSPPPHPGFDVEQAHNFVRGKSLRTFFSIMFTSVIYRLYSILLNRSWACCSCDSYQGR